MKLLIVAVLALAAGAHAACPSSCSGHGTCGDWDMCSCYQNWQGPACDQRTCAYGRSFVDVPTGTDYAHGYEECSGKGLCDRKTGECKCFDGYTGQGCRRTTCPNDCSGHGRCYFLEETSEITTYSTSENHASDGADNYAHWRNSDGTKNNPRDNNQRTRIVWSNVQDLSQSWEERKIQTCVCDPGYEGPDCSSRMCPRGDDIMTPRTLTGAGASNQVSETINLNCDDTTAIGGTFVLKFTDLMGAEWYTRPITAASSASFSVSTACNALKALPNKVVEGVTCGAVGASSNNGFEFDITWSSAHTAGNQYTLEVETVGCNEKGCFPKYEGLVGACTITSGTRATVESAVCGGRGSCDSSTGVCECFPGYHDEACTSQTALF